MHLNKQSVKRLRRLARRPPARPHDLWRTLAPFLAGAAVFLAVAVIIVLTWQFPTDRRTFELELVREEVIEPLEAPPPEEADARPIEQVADTPAVEVDLPDEIVPSLTEINTLAAPVTQLNLPQPPVPEAVALVKSPVQLKSLAGGVRGTRGRLQALKRFGGNAEVETAVLRALRWLKRQQLDNGGWKAKGEGDATAFALLAFLAHGEDFTSPEFGSTVKAAVGYLLEHHGNNMAVYALAEAAAVIRTPVLDEAVTDAVREFCARQKSVIKANTGGIIQKYAAVMTLVSVRLARLEIPETERVRETYTRAFLEMRDGKGPDFRRIRGSGTWHFMVAGVCLQYLRHGEDASTRRMLQRLDELWLPATLGPTPIACCPVRSNYFSTMIFFNAGGPLWEKWNAGMLSAYLSSQETDGQDGGFWHCQDQHIGDQPFWTTCYVVHQLMVYYRYLPTYSPEAWSPATKEANRDWTDPKAVTVEVDI